MTARFTIANQKGGVGKTITAITLGRRFADLGIRVLLVDADPQGSISTIVKLRPELYLNDFLFNKRRLADCVARPVPGLDILCSNRDTFEAEQRATGTIGRERIFENLFGPLEEDYDLVMIDVGPSLSLLQVCAMVYTRDYLVPISMDTLSVTGASGLFNTADNISEQLKVDCRCIGLLPTIVDHRYQNTDKVTRLIQVMSEHHKVPMLHGIRTDSTVSKANRNRQFIADCDPKSKCYEDYRVVTDQILQYYGLFASTGQEHAEAPQVA